MDIIEAIAVETVYTHTHRLFKKDKGITLVALVITIIILLTLAGITINALTNTGLLKKAQLAANESKYANAEEKVVLAVNASYDKTGNLNDNELKDNINKIDGLDKKIDTIKYDLKIVVDGFQFTISKYGKITGEKTEVATLPENKPDTETGTEVKTEEGWNTQTVYAVSVGNGEIVPIPKGFYYVGGTLESGVVISDNSKDKNKYSGVENVPDGAVYNTDGTVKTNEFTIEEEKKSIIGNQFVWIPCKEKEYAKYNFGIGYGDWDFHTPEVEKIQIQKYGGFYIGRYEAGTSEITLKDNYTFEEPIGTASYGGYENPNFTSDKVISGKITCKAGEIPYYHSDYKTALDMTEAMYSTNCIQSSLVTGTMWDMAIKFISERADYSDLKNTPWGNYNTDMSNVEGSTIDYEKGRYLAIGSKAIEQGAFTKADGKYYYAMRTTGWTEGSKKKNIYDLAGNLWEWTEEISDLSDSYYVFRGRKFSTSVIIMIFQYVLVIQV